MKRTGTVIRKPFAIGSKSERDGIFLSTERGDEYLLRRLGGNPFHDPALDDLVGKKITCTGTLTGYTMLMEAWKETGRKPR